MSVTGDLMELREEDIRRHYPAAHTLLDGFEHAPRIAAAEPVVERSGGLGTRRAFRSTTPGLVTARVSRRAGVHLLASIAESDAGDPMTSPRQAAVGVALRRALAVALAVGEEFGAASGLADLKRANLENALAANARSAFSELLTGEALAVLHVFANTLAYLLAPQQGEASVDIGEVEEVLSDNAPLALQGVLWELDRDIAAHAGDDQRLVATVTAFAEALMDKVAQRARTAPRLEAFTGAVWRIEADDLVLRGFTPAGRTGGGPLTMQFRTPQEVIGNHIAKHQAMKLAKMLMAYDFSRQMNPFAELGGFIFTFMGDGAPGTGKTTLIQMMAGLLNEYCANAGYPFRYQNLSIESVDSYQGKSGQNARAFIDAVLDPAVIGFGTIDDIDQIAGKRGDRQSSTGQQEITAVLMEAFAGANTVVRGNCTFGMFSNFPENVDDALRQRAGARFLVDGPQSRDDYIDILTLLLGKGHRIPLGDHDAFAAQQIQRAVAESYAEHTLPQGDRLRAVFDDVQRQVGALETLAQLGTYLKAIQQADARFTGRAVKNITDAVKVRAMDVELPDEWMAQPELFLARDYDVKLAMIEELRQPITAGMVVQEINRYAESEFRYSGKSDEAAVEAMVREMGIRDAAKKRYLGEGG